MEYLEVQVAAQGVCTQAPAPVVRACQDKDLQVATPHQAYLPVPQCMVQVAGVVEPTLQAAQVPQVFLPTQEVLAVQARPGLIAPHVPEVVEAAGMVVVPEEQAAPEAVAQVAPIQVQLPRSIPAVVVEPMPMVVRVWSYWSIPEASEAQEVMCPQWEATPIILSIALEHMWVNTQRNTVKK
jgi:hypothetical protein